MFKLLVPCFSGIFKSELQAVILACRRTRSFIDQVCCKLINQAIVVKDVSSFLTVFTFRYQNFFYTFDFSRSVKNYFISLVLVIR